MFEPILSTNTTPAVVGGVYQALTELFKLRGQRRSWTNIRVEVTQSPTESPEQEAASEVALSILQQIRSERNKDLSKLTEDELREIAEELTRIVEERTAAEPHYDEVRGGKLLDDLRNEYPVAASGG